MQTIDVSQAQSMFPQLLEAVAAGEEVILTRNAKPFVKLSLVNGVKAQKREGDLVYGSAKGLMTMSEDFDDPIDNFKDYM